MKQAKFLIILMLFSYIANGDVVDSTINLKGYYVVRYEKAEIINLYKQEVKKQRGESFTLSTDLETEAFFIPFEVGSNKVTGLKKISNQIKNHNEFGKDTVFYLPRMNRIQEILNKLSSRRYDLSEALCLFKGLQSISPYFTIKGIDKYLYKCVYVDGKAQAFHIENNYENRFKIDLDVDAVNKSSAKIWIFFLTTVRSYNPYQTFEGLTLWYPYISK